jgi:hypothetical protein
LVGWQVKLAIGQGREKNLAGIQDLFTGDLSRNSPDDFFLIYLIIDVPTYVTNSILLIHL